MKRKVFSQKKEIKTQHNMGGVDEVENLVTACERCNVEKGTKSLRNENSFKERLKLVKNGHRN